MFQFPACPPVRLWIHLTVTGSSPAGFPHSDIHGSMPACGSPWLFAACHVLLRRMVPGHPPCALCSLIFSPNPETNCGDLSKDATLWLTSPMRGCPKLEQLWVTATALPSIFRFRFRRLQLAFFLNLCCAVVKVRFAASVFQEAVGRSGLEPPTSRLSGECSNRLS